MKDSIFVDSLSSAAFGGISKDTLLNHFKTVSGLIFKLMTRSSLERKTLHFSYKNKSLIENIIRF